MFRRSDQGTEALSELPTVLAVSLFSFICYAGWVSSVAQRVFGGVSVGLVLNKRGDESCVEDLLKFFFRVSACDLRLS